MAVGRPSLVRQWCSGVSRRVAAMASCRCELLVILIEDPSDTEDDTGKVRRREGEDCRSS